ncbi:DUF806 family protein [Liquorilactobacillus mali]|uniref:Phage tail protein n=1 Tax=Liquorilactobacillus mali KCTC 3596 = DSM 20444 TaxID=1046596 RepID=J0UT35_9LACO|nr:DUF806 family protein [Liquorilactobacillus mali]EJF00344.1 phage tail protein [Liquorilactobacillus mali KCTC 3596 = DSM 20444]KRN08828.1 phage tail protein [Liquorilactobacillus mali KCTC 3596 = DSM 20444]QFQ74578.1 DUF806 family protein [Liquorilactobacillus mali]
MQLPAVQAKNTFQDGNFNFIDNIYQGSIPEEVQNNTDTTDVLIQEYINEPFYYANKTFKGWRVGVEVQIFYSLKTGFNLQDAEVNIAKQFINDGWRIDQSKNRVKDPGTKQWTKVFYFVKDIKGGL